MRSGQVKFFLHDKGFGFVKPDDNGPDIFLHATAVRNSGLQPDNLTKGMKVRYEAAPGKKGEQAIRIEPA